MPKITSFLFFTVGCFLLFAGSAVGQTSRPSVSAAEVNGTFRIPFRGKFKDLSNEIKILALGGGKVRVAMDLAYPYLLRNGESMANMGSLDGQANISRDTAIFESNEFGACKITIRFLKPGSIKVTQNGTDADCGFGHNVSADGTYRKVSGRKPRFED